MEPLTAGKLDRMQCSFPDCESPDHTELFLHSMCHPEIPTWASYDNGVLVIRCAQDDKVVVRIKVAQ